MSAFFKNFITTPSKKIYVNHQKNMGGVESRFMMEDFSPVRNKSEEHKITEWDTFKCKNWQYYNGERFTTISRNMYPQYTKGWFYGYTIDDRYYEKILYNQDQE